MRNRFVFSCFLIASFLVIELSACADQAAGKAQKDVVNAKRSASTKHAENDKTGDLTAKPSNISLPDVITYFMSSF